MFTEKSKPFLSLHLFLLNLHLSCHHILFFTLYNTFFCIQFSCIQHTFYFPEKGLYKVFLYSYNGLVIANLKHYDGDSKYPQTDPRESGIGASLTSGKIWKITPEWQTEQVTQ